MKIKSVVKIAVLLGFAVISRQVLAQGSLTPPGAPGLMMKTLDQIEPRTPISSAPFTITKAGSYYLTTNLTVTGAAGSSNAITITANGVTLDLNGFTISSTAASPSGSGILLGSSLKNINIMNGSIKGNVTEVGGVFSGGGFDFGIFPNLDANDTNTSGLPSNLRVSGISISGCMTYGMALGGVGTIVDSCTLRTIGGTGIFGGVVKNSTVTDCGNIPIYAAEVSDCHAECVGNAWGIYAFYFAKNCYGSSVGSDGIHSQQLAENCYGVSSASGYAGLYADSAQSCYGVNFNGTGLRATSTAINCHGMGFVMGLDADGMAENCYGRCSTNGVGLYGYSAMNCFGYCPAGNFGVGLSSSQAMNCFGQDDENGIGLQSTIAIGCHGRCYGNNYAISSYIINSCYYYRQTGTPSVSGYKFNMP
jgi:hypothetical protein